MGWTYRVRYWEVDMSDWEFTQEEPAAFAAVLGNDSMALTLRRLDDIFRSGNSAGGGVWRC
ncbi:hypothetical protein ColLi_12212 [Colletotrichum liriopes]|uniref:Uncharacterized protein n=1 Tax=Colletotrichum liriopes TaxID=708192 RepID=A0AA37GYT9_9PEZI|nr:hypothetical protein ColLi_12212 [Colletotrichum liriopes]